MAKKTLSRRETEMMDIIYRLGEATAADVLERMAEPPSYSAVRSTLSVLEGKGHLGHRHVGKRYVYVPTVDRDAARRSALDHMLETFFDGSAANVVSALLAEHREDIGEEDLRKLAALIEQARREGR